MKRRLFFFAQAVLIVLLAGAGSVGSAGAAQYSLADNSPSATGVTGNPQAPASSPVGPGFTYQGRLSNGGNPANGSFDFQFTLYDASSGGLVAGGPTTVLSQTVSGGLFTASLDFGSSPFQGSAIWLEVAVRPSGGGSYTTLSPRQALTASPYALGLVPGAVISGGNNSAILAASNTSTGNGLNALASAGNASALYGRNDAILGFGVTGWSTNGTGAYGTSFSSNGVLGTSTNGIGVMGGSEIAQGVRGYSTSGSGVEGTSTSGTGVTGGSQTSQGVYGYSTSYIGVKGSSTTAQGVYGTSASNVGTFGGSTSSYGVFGSSGSSNGVEGNTTSSAASGVHGENLYGGNGVYGTSTSGNGVSGQSATGPGVSGQSTSGWGMYAVSGSDTGLFAVSNSGVGIDGRSSSNAGIVGSSSSNIGIAGSSNGNNGVQGTSASSTASGVYGQSTNGGYGVSGRTGGATTSAVYGQNTGEGYAGYFLANSASGIGTGIYASGGNWAGNFNGNVRVSGHITALGGCCSMAQGTTQIDDPLDPANKVLNQALVQSPEMLNIYRGHIVLDANGEAVVQLPDYFQALNGESDYQLTPIGAPAPNLYVAQEVKDNHFRIAGGKPGMKVSWQVTGVRQDAYAKAHPITAEQDKSAEEKGKYLHPTEAGQPESKGIDYDKQQNIEPQAPSVPAESKVPATPPLSTPGR